MGHSFLEPPVLHLSLNIVIVDCSRPLVPDNVILQPDTGVYYIGEIVTTGCLQGYNSSGAKTPVCLKMDRGMLRHNEAIRDLIENHFT